MLALIAVLAGCGSSASKAGETTSRTCAASVVDTLGSVLRRVYREGVLSERTASARHMILRSIPLREAVEHEDAGAATAAAKALLATGHMSNLRVLIGKRQLIDVGGPALTPLKGDLLDATGKSIGSYFTSVWSDSGFTSEGDGVSEGLLELRVGTKIYGGAVALPPPDAASEGTFSTAGVDYQYTSFHAEAFPSGDATVYLFRSLGSTTALCGSGDQDTTVNTLSRIADLIYAAEGGRRTLTQIHRVQRNLPLLQAVAQRDPAATKVAVEALLHHHIVRLRVSVGSQLLVDDGGPYVLAPVSAPLRLHGHTIGSFILSIQDDEGYLRLTKRLAGLSVLMYMGSTHPQLVKNSLGPNPGSVPTSGSYNYRGHEFRVHTVHAEAFPSGPLTIKVLIPIPYS